MLSVFNTLKAEFASREITMNDLERLQQHDFIHFENRGISRSERDCLLCEVRCEPFETFLERVRSSRFESADVLREFVACAALGLGEVHDDDPSVLTFGTTDGTVEIVATVQEDGSVGIDPEDIEAEPSFQVYLRVQGF
jgi:hypothetical protein